ncbi:hypothetical protein MLD38_010764 [Melastoma candidum]|uniref:Uncharacterized protein n=1 Tax=Melastoma candidum TaxID=119954 RepID=A0ACB9R201_9MYRT|nr:hypothetical protein MLD38_010764 [Melastoma candidum]
MEKMEEQLLERLGLIKSWKTKDLVSETHIDPEKRKLVISQQSGLKNMCQMIGRIEASSIGGSGSLFSQTPEEYFGFVEGSKSSKEAEERGDSSAPAKKGGGSSISSDGSEEVTTDALQGEGTQICRSKETSDG